MSLRARVAALAELALRVPPLFLVDELLKLSLGLPAPPPDPEPPLDDFLAANISLVAADDLLADVFIYDADFFRLLIFNITKFLLCCCGCVFAIGMFLLRMKHLIIMYMYLTSIGVIFLSYWSNIAMIKQILVLSADASKGDGPINPSILENLLSLNLTALVDLQGPAIVMIQNYILQFILSSLFYNISLGPRHKILQYTLPWSFMLPSVIALLPFPESVLQHSPVFATLLPLAIVKYVLCSSTLSVIRIVFESYQKARIFAGNFGLSALIEFEWSRLNVPCVLRIFWIVRVLEHAGLLLMDNYELSDERNLATMLGVQNLAILAKSLLVTGCETITAVLGMTSIISFFCHYIGNFFQWILMTDDDEDRNIGTVSAILFYILALQTGLTSLNPEKRFVRLCRNFFLLFAALLHFIHNIVNPILMSLSASHNPSRNRHIRALCVCTFLVTFPIVLLCYLWSNHALSTWLLAVSVFSIEVIVKVAVSLMIYSLFLLDAYRTTFWEKLDDYVYYIRGFGNTVEFCFGIFLFFNGAWILMFESGGAIRAIMMCIHAYFNIWCEARAGWSVFMKRRTAVIKIESLPEASEEQLKSLDDVCAICYQEMNTAKITKCNHYFHGVCLRKWLYVQDRCPLCHEILYKIDKDNVSESGSEAENMNNENILEEDQANALGVNAR